MNDTIKRTPASSRVAMNRKLVAAVMMALTAQGIQQIQDYLRPDLEYLGDGVIMLAAIIIAVYGIIMIPRMCESRVVTLLTWFTCIWFMSSQMLQWGLAVGAFFAPEVTSEWYTWLGPFRQLSSQWGVAGVICLFLLSIGQMTLIRARLLEEQVRLRHEIEERINAERAREQALTELRESMSQIKRLQGLLPICSSCKMIRDEEGAWHEVASYIAARSEVDFTHGLCQSCADKLYPGMLDGQAPDTPVA